MTDEFLIDSLHSLSCFIAILRSTVFGTRPLGPRGSGRDGARNMSGRSLSITSVGAQRKAESQVALCAYLSHQSPWNLRCGSSGMEPETVLWGPELQGPEESQNNAHGGEGHKGL